MFSQIRTTTAYVTVLYHRITNRVGINMGWFFQDNFKSILVYLNNKTIIKEISHNIIPIIPIINPAIAKPGESSFLIPIPPQIMATTENTSGVYHKTTIGNVIGKIRSKTDDNPTIPKINATIPRDLAMSNTLMISNLNFYLKMHSIKLNINLYLEKVVLFD